MGGHWEALAAALQQSARETGLSTEAGRGSGGQVIGLWLYIKVGSCTPAANGLQAAAGWTSTDLLASTHLPLAQMQKPATALPGTARRASLDRRLRWARCLWSRKGRWLHRWGCTCHPVWEWKQQGMERKGLAPYENSMHSRCRFMQGARQLPRWGCTRHLCATVSVTPL